MNDVSRLTITVDSSDAEAALARVRLAAEQAEEAIKRLSVALADLKVSGCNASVLCAA